MRSGREHNTPDKAMWGFACTVRAQVYKRVWMFEQQHCLITLSVQKHREQYFMKRAFLFLLLMFLPSKESSEDVSGGLPFLADLALGLSVLACSMLRILYNGPEVTREEEACQDLLCSKLLQR